MKKPEPVFVAICRQEEMSDPTVYVGTYEEVVQKAGQYWKDSDLDFDPKTSRFYAESGYDMNVEVSKTRGNYSREPR